MATTIDKFDSTGGFSIARTAVIDELRNGKDFNTLEIKNSQYTDSNTTTYILRGVNTASLALDGVGTQIPIANNTMNFVTGHVIAVNDTGVVFRIRHSTNENRRMWLQDPDLILGKRFTFKYYERSSKGVPIQPTGVGFRDYE